MARPSKYTKELAAEICKQIGEGKSIRQICKSDKMPNKSTVMLWVVEDREGFSDQYTKACEVRAHLWSEDLMEIADDGSNDWMEHNDPNNQGYKMNGEAVARSRLRVDSRKWVLSKMLPKFKDKEEDTSKDDIAKALAIMAEKLPG